MLISELIRELETFENLNIDALIHMPRYDEIGYINLGSIEPIGEDEENPNMVCIRGIEQECIKDTSVIATAQDLLVALREVFEEYGDLQVYECQTCESIEEVVVEDEMLILF